MFVAELVFVGVLFVIAAVVITACCVSLGKRNLRAESDRLEELKKRKEMKETLREQFDPILVHASSSIDTFPFLNDLSYSELLYLSGFAYEVDLGSRMKFSKTRDELEARVKIAWKALKEIQQASCIVGYDSGHSGIHKIASEALEKISAEIK